MPLANCTTAANGSERDQVMPLLDRVKLKTLKRGNLLTSLPSISGFTEYY